MAYIQPLLPFLLLLALAGLLRVRRGKKSRLAILSVAAILLFSWPPVDWLLSRPLEARYPIRPFPSAPAQAIVVLGSSVSPKIYERPYALPDRDTYQRCEYAAWLHQQWQPLPVLVSGGPSSRTKEAVAATMRQLLQRAGVPETMIWTEERSRSTHENAAFSAQILRQHGIGTIVLVVEANSMLRAEACFRKEGISVIPAPCEFREIESLSDELIPSWKSLRRNELILHEIVGLAWYWIHRWV